MKFYDLHVQSKLSGGENSVEELASFSKDLGYSGIAICDTFQDIEKLRQLKEEIKSVNLGIEIYPGVIVQAKDPIELKNTIDKVREEVVILIVSGGNYVINRAACENSKVDILAHPEFGRIDSGLDEACLNTAIQNNVAIQINFKNILNNYRKPRSYMLNHIGKNIMLCDNFRTPIVICSGAQSKWDMRAPRELVSITNLLGLEIGKAFASITSIPQQIVEKNIKKLEGKQHGEVEEI